MRVFPHLIVLLSALGMACSRTAPTPGPGAGQPTDSVPAADAPDTLPRGTVSGIKNTELIFADGRHLDTGLKGLRYGGTVMVNGEPRHVLLLADRTVDNTTERALYIIGATDTVPPKGDREHSWNAPGNKLDGETGEPFQKVTVYFGTVLPDTVGVIWYEEALMPDGQWKHNTTLLYDGPKGLDTLVFFGTDRLSATNTLAYHGKCEQLKGPDEREAP